MKNNSPQKQAAISWIILMIGILLAVIGAMTAKEYRVNLCLLIGAMVVVGGIVYHLTMMKCPYCGCSLVGYRPIPKDCLLYTSPSPRDVEESRMPSSA